MTYSQILFPLLTSATPLPRGALENARRLAVKLGGKVTAMALEIRIKAPGNRLANLLIHIDRLAEEENQRSVKLAHDAGEVWRAFAKDHALPTEIIQTPVELFAENDVILAAARTRDITLIPVRPLLLGDPAPAETVLFGSGHPVLIFPDSEFVSEGPAFDRVIVAWDASRAAARAVSDALPLLAAAGETRILMIHGDKPAHAESDGADLVRFLAGHGISAVLDEVDLAGRLIGGALEDQVARFGADLLVMGGFGHSRAREFILGGATASVLRDPICPVFLSH